MKGGQTLSQRPDLIGEEAADVKSLQQENVPFEDAIAFQAVVEKVRTFRPFSRKSPVSRVRSDVKAAVQIVQDYAYGEFRQVYKARRGKASVAVKVQRPSVRKQVALDWTCWSLSLSALRKL